MTIDTIYVYLFEEQETNEDLNIMKWKYNYLNVVKQNLRNAANIQWFLEPWINKAPTIVNGIHMWWSLKT